jgi:hypothetical protein
MIVQVFDGDVGLETGCVELDALDPMLTVVSRTLGEKEPLFCTTPADPSAVIAAATPAGVIVGSRSRYNAATPVPKGVDMLVPESVLVAVVLVDHALVIEVPGLSHIISHTMRMS